MSRPVACPWRVRPYFSSAPNTLPVLGLTMWACLQAKQVTASWVSLSPDPSSANHP
jgi:hypothetical protein